MSAKTAESGLKKPALLVEIGEDCVKLAQCEPSRGGASMSRLFVHHFTGADEGSLPGVIADAVRTQRFTRSRVIGCLPRRNVNVRMLELPSTEPAEIADMVDLQVGKQTPYSRDEIVSDYRIIGVGRSGYTRIMLAIVQRSILRHHFNIVEAAGLNVERMSISSEGLFNWFRYGVGAGVSGSLAILDVDSEYSDLAIVSDGVLVYTRGILLGANRLVADPDAAAGKLAGEVRRSVEICRSESGGLEIDKVMLTGAGTRIEPLAGALESELSVSVQPVESTECLRKVPESLSAEDDALRTVSLTPLVGMAIGERALDFNLVPDSVRMRTGLVSKARALTVFGILVMLVLVSGSVLGTLKYSLRWRRLNQVREAVEKTAPAVREIEHKRTVLELVNERRDTRFSAISVLNNLHDLVPEGVYLDDISFDRRRQSGQLRLEGTAGTRSDVGTFINSLEGSALLRDALREGPTSWDRDTGRYRFRLVCTLEEDA